MGITVTSETQFTGTDLANRSIMDACDSSAGLLDEDAIFSKEVLQRILCQSGFELVRKDAGKAQDYFSPRISSPFLFFLRIFTLRSAKECR